METPRRRVYSFSSNETILEIYSSTPPSSPGPPDHDATPTWQLSTKDLLAPVCHETGSGKRNLDDLGQRDSQQRPAAVNEEAVQDDSSEESINWDEDPEEESERQQRWWRREEPKGQSAFPQTIGFWFDCWIAQVGATATNVSCLLLPY